MPWEKQTAGLRSHSPNRDEEIGHAVSNAVEKHQNSAKEHHDDTPELQLSESAPEEVDQAMTSHIAVSSFLQQICRMIYSDPFEAINFEIDRRVRDRSKQTGAFEAGFTISQEFGASLDWEVVDPVGRIGCGRLLK